MIVIEEGENSFGAYIPDLPGCVAVGETESEVKQLIDNTALGRNRKKQGKKNYSSFQEFLNHADSFQNLE